MNAIVSVVMIVKVGKFMRDRVVTDALVASGASVRAGGPITKQIVQPTSIQSKKDRWLCSVSRARLFLLLDL